MLLLLLPAAGRLLNGGSYTINRWTWATAMLAGWISVRAAADLLDLTLVRGKAGPARSFALLLPALTLCSVAWNIVYGFAPGLRAFPQEFLDRMSSTEFYALATDNEVAAVAAVGGQDDHEFFRYSGRNLNWNAALGSGLSSTQFEFSFANGTVSDYYQLIGMNEQQNFAWFALDDRMLASSLAGGRYYTLAYDNYYEYRFIPYGFVDLGMTGSYHVYENPNALPLGYAVDTVISRAELQKLPLAVREETLTCAAVVEEAETGSLPEMISAETESIANPSFRILTAEDALAKSRTVEVPFTVRCGDGVRFEESRFTVSGDERWAVLSFDGESFCETLVGLEGLTVTGSDALYNIDFTLLRDGEDYVTKTLPYKTPELQYYSDWHDFLVNLCYSEEAAKELRIDFPANGVYSFDRLSVVCRPMADFPEKLQALGETRLANIHLHENPISRATNEITGELALDKDALLVLNLPYTTGFSAWVDGERTSLWKTDAMFLSLPVSAGAHDIRIVYRTPGLLAGLLCSALGLLLVLGMAFLRTGDVEGHRPREKGKLR